MKITIALLAALLLAPAASAQTAQDVAKEVLAAYKNKDLEGVKKHTAPMLAAAMDDKFFEDKEIKASVKDLQSWNGKVKEVRYFKSPMGVMAAAHYGDADKDTYRVLDLINAGYGWKQMGGVSTVSKKKFLSYDKKEPKAEAASKTQKDGGRTGKGVPGNAGVRDQLSALGFGFGKNRSAAKEAPKAGPYSVEMADGTEAKGPSAGDIRKMLASLNDDNFFLTLSASDGGFMQGSYTKAGLDMQYKDSSGQFSSEAVVAPGTAEEMFLLYLGGDAGWKNKCKWKPFE
jgi:hypothetical protein